jgi:hypothetical protein
MKTPSSKILVVDNFYLIIYTTHKVPQFKMPRLLVLQGGGVARYVNCTAILGKGQQWVGQELQGT